MDHYFDVRLRPDPEFGQHQLMSALFSKLHRALAESKSQDIGISFPEVDAKKPTLGGHLRLHGPATALQQLMDMNWLVGMRDHILLGVIQAVPAKVSYRVVSRVQARSSTERVRRRQMRRHGLSETDACERIPDIAVERLKLPFVSIRSQSTSQSFHLFIEHGASIDVSQPGMFNSYGLSHGATIPWF